MIRRFKTPQSFRYFYPSLIWDLPKTNSIYLTFDDGPDPKVTPWVLDLLDEANAKATFFCCGKNLRRYPDVARQILKEGHSLGNHTFNHLNGWKANSKKYVKDVEQCDGQIAKLDVSTDLFRPPYGRITTKQIRLLSTRRKIMWSYLSWDFDEKVKDRKILKALAKASEGDILLFHDTEKAFPKLKNVLPELIDIFIGKGLKLEAIT